MFNGSRRGTSLIDLLVSMGIIAVLFGGIYLIYFSLITAIGNVSVRTAAASAIQAEIETIRNLPYDSVGTVGGVPPGVILQSQSVLVGNYSFTLLTTVRNIDDPFDGTLSGTPSPVDTAPADYKLVSIQALCPQCNSTVSVTVTTTVAPKSLESASQNGSLFITADDAGMSGIPKGVLGATVHVVNPDVSPSIDLTDTTNASGVLQLVGVPTSTGGYQIMVSKAGYSSDQTYPFGAPANPNPNKPNPNVSAETVTGLTFQIDRTSALTVHATDNRCAPIGNLPFSMTGGKLIGTNPDVVKFATTSVMGALGTATFPALEWDTYTFALNDATRNVVGTMPLSPFVVNPSSTVDFRFIVQPAANPSLLVTAVDAATQATQWVGVPNATTTVSEGGFSSILTTGHAFLTQTDWSGGQYSAQSGGVDADSSPGTITLLVNASGTYNPGTNDWLISNSFDLGGTSSTLYSISWDPGAQPPTAGDGSLKFQIAANIDNATWNFIGPDGTADSYFTTSSTPLPASLSGNRYLRYKVFLNTNDGSVTPGLDDVTFEFSANCVPPGQALFTGLPQGTYTVDISAANYAEASTTVSVGSGAQSATVFLTHL
jgi:hypothetical protein